MHVLNRSEGMELMSDYLRCETARSLDLIRKIDGTIESLVLLRRQMDAFSEAAQSLANRVCLAPEVSLPEEDIIPALEQSQESAARIYKALQPKFEAAKNAPELDGDECVIDAYLQAISSVLSFNDTVERLRWVILEHNADMEGPHEANVLTTDEEIDDFFKKL